MQKRVLVTFGLIWLLAGGIAAACSSDTTDVKNSVATVEQQVQSLSDASSNLERSDEGGVRRRPTIAS